MASKIQIMPKASPHSIVIHPQRAKELQIHPSTSYSNLYFGVSKHLVNIRISHQVPPENMLISENILNRLRIPLYAHYEINVNHNGIHIGPYMGFLLSYSSHSLADYLPYLADYLPFYDTIGGTWIVFAYDGVRKESRTIFGYIYNPLTKKWEKGVYGYPSSLFIKTAMLPPGELHYFQSQMGMRVFNNFNFDKWEMHRFLTRTNLQEYLPKTKLYKQSQDFEPFLKYKEPIYLKPVNGSRGRSVTRINKSKKGITIRYREDGKNEKLVFSNWEAFKKYLKKSIQPKAYIIQKAIKLLSYEGSIIDFRMLMVKDDRGQWKDLGLVSRYGPVESVVSNISAGGLAEEGERTLQKVLGISDQERVLWRKKLRRIALEVAQSLDHSNIRCGNMGVDFGIDIKGRIWILEIQHNNPDPTLALDAKDPHVYQNILYHHLLYLKGLAGFKGESALLEEDTFNE